jgi:tetratricopeptide (TPR) repeat protein
VNDAVGIAERLRDERQRAGLTKTALARPRYTVSYVSQIESGRRSPSPEALAYFAERLDVSPSYLASGVPEGAELRLRFDLEDARLALRDDRLEEAEKTADTVLEESERFGLATVRSKAKVVAADVRMRTDRVREAIDLYEEALEAALPEPERGVVTAALARAYRRVGDLSYAAEIIEAFLNRRDHGPLEPGVAADLQTVLVSIYFERGDIVRAERTAARAMAAADQDTSPEIRARTYWDASRVLAEAGRWEEALDLVTRARALLEHLDDRRRLARVFNATAFICLESDPPRTLEAAAHLDRAEALLDGAGIGADLAYVLTERARIALLEGRFESAVSHAERSAAAAGQDDLEAGRALYVMGRALGELGRRREARATFREAAARFEKHGAHQQEASCWRELGELELVEGDLAAAVDALRSGLQALVPERSRA